MRTAVARLLQRSALARGCCTDRRSPARPSLSPGSTSTPVDARTVLAEAHRQGATLLMSTHDLETAVELCDSAVVLRAGASPGTEWSGRPSAPASRRATARSCTATPTAGATAPPARERRRSVSDADADLEGPADRAAHQGDALLLSSPRHPHPPRPELRLRPDERDAHGGGAGVLWVAVILRARSASTARSCTSASTTACRACCSRRSIAGTIYLANGRGQRPLMLAAEVVVVPSS